MPVPLNKGRNIDERWPAIDERKRVCALAQNDSRETGVIKELACSTGGPVSQL